jgi:DNA-binding PadR family transcriptional regulator
MVLAALEREPAHGYAIIAEIRGRTRGTFDLADGTIYPALQRLEDGGLLKSSWMLVGGRSRRVYGLTARGRSELSRRRRGWRTFSLAVTRAIG